MKTDTVVNDHFRRLQQVSDLIEQKYVETPDYQRITEKGVTAMLSELDPHSVYIAAKDVQRSNEGLQANFEGVGIAFQIVDDTISVTDVIAGGPCEKVGMMIGDKLLKIDDTLATYKGVNNSFVFNHLRGPRGTKVVLTVHRQGEATPLVFNIVRDKIPLHSIDTYFMLDEEVGYIRLTRFARTSHTELRAAIRELKGKGMKRLIFDLRGNSGGFLDIAFGIANEFLDAGKLIVYTKGDKSPRRDYRSRRGGTFTDGALVVMIDEYSASASEIVSGAVQDWDRGTLVGRRSFGKGLVQQMMELYDGAQIRLTTARYYTPSGRCIQKPYDEGTDAYHMDLRKRYEHNEMVNADSVSFPDSLKFETASGRVVYGGGGIMPDVFVPMDTMRLSDYYISLRGKGLLNTFPQHWADAHRKQAEVKTFDLYLKNYDTFKLDSLLTAEALEKGVVRDAEKEASQPERTAHSDRYLRLMLKAQVARSLFGIDYYYKVMKEVDDGYQRALDILSK